VSTQSHAQATPVNISKAKCMFESRCTSCHTVGGGGRMGPDLAGVTERRDAAWLKRYLKEPEKGDGKRRSDCKNVFLKSTKK
jgi:protein SCO1/2